MVIVTCVTAYSKNLPDVKLNLFKLDNKVNFNEPFFSNAFGWEVFCCCCAQTFKFVRAFRSIEIVRNQQTVFRLHLKANYVYLVGFELSFDSPTTCDLLEYCARVFVDKLKYTALLLLLNLSLKLKFIFFVLLSKAKIR